MQVPAGGDPEPDRDAQKLYLGPGPHPIPFVNAPVVPTRWHRLMPALCKSLGRGRLPVVTEGP